LLILEKGL